MPDDGGAHQTGSLEPVHSLFNYPFETTQGELPVVEESLRNQESTGAQAHSTYWQLLLILSIRC